MFKTVFKSTEGSCAEDGNQLPAIPVEGFAGNVHKRAFPPARPLSASSTPAGRISPRSATIFVLRSVLLQAETVPNPRDAFSSLCQIAPLPPRNRLPRKFPSPYNLAEVKGGPCRLASATTGTPPPHPPVATPPFVLPACPRPSVHRELGCSEREEGRPASKPPLLRIFQP